MRESELELECGGGSINKERRLHGEIRDLKKIKAQMLNGQSSGLKSEIEAARVALDAAWSEINELRDQEREMDEKLDALTKERQEKMKEVQVERKPEERKPREPLEEDGMEGIREALKECREAMDAARDTYKNVQQAHNTWLNDYRTAREGARKQEQAARDEEKRRWQQEKADLAKEKELVARKREVERRMNPKAEEIQMCVTLIDFLCKGQKAERARQAQSEPATGFDPHTKAPSAGGKKLSVMTGKKTENDSSFAFPKKKKVKVEAVPATADSVKNMKAPTEAVGALKRPLKLMMQQTAAFSRIGVPPPAFTDEVAKAVEDLQRKRADFEKRKKSEAEATKEVDQEGKKKAQSGERRQGGRRSGREAGKPREPAGQ